MQMKLKNYENKKPNKVPTDPPHSHATIRSHCQRVPSLTSRRNASAIRLTTATTIKEYTHTLTVGASDFAEPMVIRNEMSKPMRLNKMLLLLNFFIFFFLMFNVVCHKWHFFYYLYAHDVV